jgi:hypothetical protein
MAYGTDAAWGQFDHGIQFIVWSRRLQWPLAATALILCLIVAALVIAGRRRAWWLAGLLPVLVLFGHRFLTGPLAGARVVQNPPCVEPSQAGFVHDTDSVVGVRVGESAFAYPCALLDDTPAVVQDQRQIRFILMWSPLANLATAFTVRHDLSARDLEIVSSPAGALLLYDGRLGQFINGVTGETVHQQKPPEFSQPLAATTTTWAQWHQENPGTLVMAPQRAPSPLWPHRLQWERYPLPGEVTAGGSAPVLPRRVCLVRTSPPIAVASEAVSDVPLNLSVDGALVLLVRDLPTGEVRAFDRHVEADLTPRFAAAGDAVHPNAAMIDVDTATEWTSAGVSLAASGATQGKTLTALPLADGVDLAVLRFWYPNLQLVEGPALAAAVQAAPPPGAAQTVRPRPTERRRRRRRAGS